MKTIAYIHNDYNHKFGVPRQSGLVEGEQSLIVFEPEYRVPEALRGIEEYSHLWLIWEFSECKDKDWSPTVRPPRLGGNKRMGVFATRSPFRPNSLGLSVVKLEEVVRTDSEGLALRVSGADLMDGTPIFDIKPYLQYVDCHPEATNGFALADKGAVLDVIIPDELISGIPQAKQNILRDILAQDPRPQYIEDDSREYGMTWAGYEIKFRVRENLLTVTDIT